MTTLASRIRPSKDEDEDEESEEHGQPEREESGQTHENQAHLVGGF